MDIDSMMDDELLPVLFTEASDELDDEEWCKAVGRAYHSVYDKLDDRDFVVNPPQMEKFAKVFRFFKKVAKNLGGKMRPMDISPKERCCGITMRIPAFDIWGDDVREFCDAISGLSALGFYPVNDRCIDISTNVPDVFIHKDELK